MATMTDLVPLVEPTPDRWFAIARARAVPRRRPLRLTRFGKDLVLWRERAGAIRAAPAACPHRGADLGLGRVVDGELECRYHGFRYAGDGACTRVPCQPPEAPISKALRLAALDVVEAHGLLWMGPRGAAPAGAPPWLPEMPEESRGAAWAEMIWPARLGRVVESMLDLHHVSFAHRRWIRGYERLEGYQVDVDGEQIRTRGAAVDPARPRRRLEGRLSVAFPASFHVGLGARLDGAVVCCPIDGERTWIGVRYEQRYLRLPLLGRLLTRLLLAAELRLIQPDDERLTVSARPRSADLGAGHLVAADRGAAEWYRLRRASLHAETR